MTLWQRIKAAFKAVPFNGEGGGDAFQWPGYWWHTYPNTNINYSQELGQLTGYSLVMAAVNWTGTTLPEAPVQVVKDTKDKKAEPIPDHPLTGLLERPNPYYSGESLWKAFSLSWIIDGNAYFLKFRNAFGKVVELWYEPHFTIRGRWPQDGSEFISYYEVLRNGQWIRVETSDVIHFRYGIDPLNPRFGLSPVASILREIFTDSERARYSALILKNGGVVPFVLTPKEGAADIDADEIKREWQYRTTGDHVGKPMVLSSPVDVQTIGITPDKLLVERASLIPEQRLSAVIGIPAIVLGFGAGLERSTFANFKEAREAAYESYIIPTLRLLDGELTVQLLADFGDTKRMRVQHDLSKVRVLQEDMNALYNRESVAYEKGIKTRAEARQALGLETTPDDDVYFVEPGMGLLMEPEDEDGETDAEQDDGAESTKAVKRKNLIGSDKEAVNWWNDNAPDGGRDLITADRVD